MLSMQRRHFLGAAQAFAGTALMAPLARALQAGANVTQQPKSAAFTAAQQRCVAAAAEIVIPATDTPGAIAAGVPAFIELIVADWFNDAERTAFSEGVNRLDIRSKKQHGKVFADVSLEQQNAVITTLAGVTSDKGTGTTTPDPDAEFFSQLRELTVVGYFTSKTGATEALQYLPMPMRYDGRVKVTDASKQYTY